MTDFRAGPHGFLNRIMAAETTQIADLCNKMLAEDVVWDVSWPLAPLVGRRAVIEGFILPMRAALTSCRRRDEMFIGGQNRRDEGGTWCAGFGHYVGNFDAPLFGLRPSGHLAFLRSGEFYRLDEGQITKARIILDLPDLMRQAGRSPLVHQLGTEMLFPGPATHDGVLPMTGDGAASADVVDGMIADLHQYDPKTFQSPGQTGTDGYWHPQMLWYGPGGVGANYLWDGFVRDHREAFLRAFPDRKGGNHYCRIGDGNYAAISGWPSMTMTHKGPYLGMEPTGTALILRVMDFYRIEEGQLAENWVCLDYGHMLHQLGRDIIAESNAITKGG